MKKYCYILLLFGVLFQNPEVAVCGNVITINTDRQMIAGYTEGVYNDAKSQVTNVDDIMEGGDSFGKVKNGITKANVDLGFTIPNNANIVIKGDEISITDEQGDVVGTLNIADQKASNEGGSVFPITVKDKEGNVYKIAPKEDTDQALADGTPLQINKVSGQTPLPVGAVNFDKVDRQQAVVTFVGAGKHAFDVWDKSYLLTDIINKHPHGRHKKCYIIFLDDLFGKILAFNTVTKKFDWVYSFPDKSCEGILNNIQIAGDKLYVLDIASDTKMLGGKILSFNHGVKNARGTTSYIDVFCPNCAVPNLKIEYKSGPSSITSATIKEQFIERDLFVAKSLDEIQWRMTHTEMTKEKLVGWLEENKEFLKTQKIIDLFETYRIDIDYVLPIRNNEELLDFLKKNNDWYTLIFK